MYADDLVLISRSEIGLQGLIDKLSGYCKRWKMEVNIDKTKVIKFSGNGHTLKKSYKRPPHIFSLVQKVKFNQLKFMII